MPPDNAATVGVGSAVQFPETGPSDGSGVIASTGPGTFNLADIGTYSVTFSVSIDEPGQLELAISTGAGPSALPYTVSGRATGTSEITEDALVKTTVINSVLSVINPSGNSTALTITPLAGGTQPVSASLVIERLG